MNGFKLNERVVFGVFVILVGFVLLLNALGVIDTDISVGTFWPVILIGYGLIRIVNYDESTFFGIIILVIGVFFQLRNLDVAFVRNVSFVSFFWPSLIILFGLQMIFSNKKDERPHGSPKVYQSKTEKK